MKRLIAVVLALVLLSTVALAESIAAVNDYVSQMGYKADSEKNKSGICVCDYYQPAKGAQSIVWSDSKTVYTIKATTNAKKEALKQLYVELLSMYGWDSCTYNTDDAIELAYNAPDLNAVKHYKTLTNYGKAVQKFIDPDGQAASTGSQSGQKNYVINLNSKKFHLPDCADVGKMKDENRQNVRRTREQLTADGYEPCQHCNP